MKPWVRIGVLAPLSRPGWVDAGTHLLAGLQQGTHELNLSGGIGGRPVVLDVRDTAADPDTAIAAVDELVETGVDAIAGEYHSVAAQAVAAQATASRIPYVCSSAVIDDLVEARTDWVARICPPQSHGWTAYAEFLLASGHSRIAVITQSSAYWEAGIAILRDRFALDGGSLTRIDASRSDAAGVVAELAAHNASAVLVLTSVPEPATDIVRVVRQEPRLRGLLIGTPAGQAELPGWDSLLGVEGCAVPFLRYLPERLGTSGARVAAALTQRLGITPSFVAFEGYDTALVLADLLPRMWSSTRVLPPWRDVDAAGSRGRIRFTRTSRLGIWQWASPPVQIADRDPATPHRFRTLRVVSPAPTNSAEGGRR